MKIHLTAICGTAMGTLAGLLQQAGHEVRGSDQSVYPPMSDQLRSIGITLMEGYRPENLAWGPELVVIGNAVSKTNLEAEEVLRKNIPYTSQAAALHKFFLEGRHPVVVAGTHGKSTTTALMAWILTSAGRDPGFFVGAVPKNFGKSFALGKGEHFVIEGDEYDTAFFDKGPKFLHYAPRTAILTSVEFDHADIYADLAAVRAAFEKFVDLIPPDGTLVACGDSPLVREVASRCRGKVEPYGISEDVTEWSGRILDASAKGARIEVRYGGKIFAEAASPLWGHHNLANQVATAAASKALGLSAAEWKKAIESFQGIRRRQEVRGITPRGVTIIDDFAHHPTAVRETLRALRMGFPEARLWAVFEPRTNTTRRAVFQKDYAEAFVGADKVVIAAVEKPEKAPEGDRFDPEQLARDLKARGQDAEYLFPVDKIVEHLKQHA
ncbi:MAG: Mur ligase family protein, partial [Bdellovibrionota bacterium]